MSRRLFMKCAVLAVLALACATCVSADEQAIQPWQYQPSQLAECMREGNVKEGPRPAMTWDRFMKYQSGQLQMRKVWWSTQRSNLPITIVTQLSTSRLQQLEMQCRSWPGPLSAAVYVPLIEVQDTDSKETRGQAGQHMQHVLTEIQQAMAATQHTRKTLATLVRQYERRLGERATDPEQASTPTQGAFDTWTQPDDELTVAGISNQNRKVLALAERAVAVLLAAVERQPLGCQLNIALVYEVLGDVRSANQLYPVNQLRNLARLQARTEVVAQLDVDMLMSWDSAAWLRSEGNIEDMVAACRNKSVYIMPAFEVHAADVEESALLSDKYSSLPKSRLEKAVAQGFITHFAAKHFPQGHNTTDFPRWFRSHASYPITYTYRLEPWLLVHRIYVPWHDVRFRGYGNNKIQQVCHINATSHTFLVHPAAFIIHRAHEKTGARLQLSADVEALRRGGRSAVKDTLYGHNEFMMRRLRVDMADGTFVPEIDLPMQHCINSLPWMKAAGGSQADGAKVKSGKGLLEDGGDMIMRR